MGWRGSFKKGEIEYSVVGKREGTRLEGFDGTEDGKSKLSRDYERNT